MPLGMQIGLPPADFVLDGHPAPLPIKGAEPASTFFGPCSLWRNDWMDQDGTWHGGWPWFRPLDRDPAPLRKKRAEPPPQFSAHFYCGQTAGRIKKLLDIKVGLTPGDCVRWGPSLPPQKKDGGASPQENQATLC